jgi:putative ABC transport system substrate-binding protein
MGRRLTKLVAAVLVLVAAPLAADAQQAGKVARVGVIEATSPSSGRPILDAFREGLRELGYTEGQNLIIEERWAEERPERFPALIAELVRLSPDVIVVGSNPGSQAAKDAKTRIPVVFAAVSDPVGRGIVASLGRPGGNLTGVSLSFEEGLSGKWLELLKDVSPKTGRVIALGRSPIDPFLAKDMPRAAQSLGIRLQFIPLRDISELNTALAGISKDPPDALIVTAAPLLFTHRGRVADVAGQLRLPTVAFSRELAVAGILMSYGPSISGSFRRAAVYVDKILKGAKPADLPVEQASRPELVVNLKTAKALGLTIPQSVLVRADQMIE